MKLRRFDTGGINRFDQFLSSAAMDTEDLHEFLAAPGLSTVVSPEIEVEARSFINRFAVGEYLYSLFGDSSIFNLDEDRGIWAWLSAFYFDQLCPDGTRPGKDYRWIPAVNISATTIASFWPGLISFTALTRTTRNTLWLCWRRRYTGPEIL